MARKPASSTPKPPASSAVDGTPPRSKHPVVSAARADGAGADPGNRDACMGSLGLLLLAGLHLGWRVEPALRYQLVAPPFFVDAPFAAKFLDTPGGPLRYGAAALAQLNFYNWLGAAVFVVILGIIFLCTRSLFARGGGAGATGAACVLAGLVAALPGRYDGEAETTALGVLTALAAAAFWQAAAPRAAVFRLPLFWALGWSLFWLAGTLALVLFVAVSVMLDWVVGGWRWLAAGQVLAVGVLFAGRWLRPGFNPWQGVQGWTGGLTLALHATVFLFAPLWLLARGIARAIVGEARLPAGWRRFHSTRRARRWCGALGLAAAAALWWTGLDESRRALARLERSVSGEDWNAALSAARAVRSWTPGARLHLLRALSHTGRLPADLFAYPQRRGLEVLPGLDAGLAMSRALGQTLLELGQVSLAEHMAHEALEAEGPRPDTLLLLSQVNILKDRPEAAKIFLNRLGLAPFHGAEAGRLLRSLATDPGGLNLPGLNGIRARLVRADEPESWLPTARLLQMLLQANRTNWMAFDYLLAHRLLKAELPELAVDLGRWQALGETTLSRPVEEALLQYAMSSPGVTNLPRGLRISSESVQRHGRFAEIARRYQGPAAARAALAAEFGETFWYYDLFGETPSASAGAALRGKP